MREGMPSEMPDSIENHPETNEQIQQEPAENVPELTRERFAELNSVNLEIATDLVPVLESVKRAIGADLQHRESGFHVTVFGPTEKKLVDEKANEFLAELAQIENDIRKGKGVTVRGIGMINGATASVPEKDRAKQVAFIALDIPALNDLRGKLGLPAKDFHVTLGFVGGDIHFATTGEKDAKGKPVTKPIEKKADERFAGLIETMPELAFGNLSGEAKEKKVVAPEDPEKEAKARLKKVIADAGLSGKDLMSLGIKPGPEMGKITSAIEASVSKGSVLQLNLEAPIVQELERRILIARNQSV